VVLSLLTLTLLKGFVIPAELMKIKTTQLLDMHFQGYKNSNTDTSSNLQKALRV
jgi:hypothetical protein